MDTFFSSWGFFNFFFPRRIPFIYYQKRKFAFKRMFFFLKKERKAYLQKIFELIFLLTELIFCNKYIFLHRFFINKYIFLLRKIFTFSLTIVLLIRGTKQEKRIYRQ